MTNNPHDLRYSAFSQLVLPLTPMFQSKDPGVHRGASKATTTTLCQKCLKRDTFPLRISASTKADDFLRHYSYECKAVAQELPYVSRPSRSQQLANPKLVPSLTSEVPQALLRKKGVADEELARRKLARGPKRDRHGVSSDISEAAKRRRSLSPDVPTSGSSISTNASKSTSREAAQYRQQRFPELKRRQPSMSSTDSYRSSSERQEINGEGQQNKDRNSRRRISELSPPVRGRQKNRLNSPDEEYHFSKDQSGSHDPVRDRRAQLRADSRSRGRDNMPGRGDEGIKYQRQRERYVDGRLGRTRRSSLNGERSTSHFRADFEQQDARNSRIEGVGKENHTGAPLPTMPEPPRERSLSPFSKRLALTQAMNRG
ncbi:MAG: hypothetical protein M1818_005415 [Claussenomyces sp. TS43310]|nr:MAG: hypothetical protein M1818_005415 [Claussenomyces sp. TS43310]